MVACAEKFPPNRKKKYLSKYTKQTGTDVTKSSIFRNLFFLAVQTKLHIVAELFGGA